MKIGVTGSDHICDRIQKTLEKRMPDLEVVYRRSNDYPVSYTHLTLPTT